MSGVICLTFFLLVISFGQNFRIKNSFIIIPANSHLLYIDVCVRTCVAGGWEVVIKPGSSPGRVVLRNNISKGIYLAINKNGGTIAGKDNQFAFLDIVIHPDNYISFRSCVNPAYFLRFLSRGGVGLPKDAMLQDDAAKFFVRAEVKLKIIISPSRIIFFRGA